MLAGLTGGFTAVLKSEFGFGPVRPTPEPLIGGASAATQNSYSQIWKLQTGGSIPPMHGQHIAAQRRENTMEDNQFENDLAKAAQLEPKHGPGRPKGSGNKSSSKTATRLRVRLHRQRKAGEVEELYANQERLFKDMRNGGLLFFGETAPTINCVSIQEEIEMARIWAKLLNVRDILPGENQRNYILDVMRAWVNADCPLLHLESLALSKRKVDVPDVEQYVWPEGFDTPFQPEQSETTQ
jgi:hypothetical protein